MTIDSTTRDSLAHIDHALAVQDATPTADDQWQPGDPLHRRGLYARPMFQMIDDSSRNSARCKECDVSWVGPEPCWMCGKPVPRPGFATLTFQLDTSAFEAGMRAFVEHFERVVAPAVGSLQTAMRDAAIGDELVRLTLGGRGPDRPELVGPEVIGIDLRQPHHADCTCLVHIRPGDLS